MSGTCGAEAGPQGSVNHMALTWSAQLLESRQHTCHNCDSSIAHELSLILGATPLRSMFEIRCQAWDGTYRMRGWDLLNTPASRYTKSHQNRAVYLFSSPPIHLSDSSSLHSNILLTNHTSCSLPRFFTLLLSKHLLVNLIL